jgi:glycosyltransferase involved in cell wall biosynthesis
MRILNVAYPFAPVSPDSVGGAEQIVHQLVEALVAAGHESLLIAREDSKTSGKLLRVPFAHGPLHDPTVRERVYQHQRELIAATQGDVIHFHGIDFYEYLPQDINTAILVTLHLPPEWYPEEQLGSRENLYFNCVSDAQFACCSFQTNATVIPNGIPMPGFRILPKKRDYVMCLGRICPEKGFHFALEAAAKIDIPLVLAGEVFEYESHQRYFRNEILSRLSRSRRFIGPVAQSRKYRLLAATRCLVVPSLANETSSLVTMEAMACGTPVVAFRRGALATLIQHGKTGLLVDHESELPEAIAAATQISPDACRDYARANFSSESMITRYLELYKRLAVTKPAPLRSLATSVVPIR